MKKVIYSILFSACLITFVSCNQKPETDSKEIAEDQNEAALDDTDIKKDSEFAVEAADGGMLEVQLGQIAMSGATSEAVRQFAKTMFEEHSKANKELEALAIQKGISLPTTLSDKNQRKLEDLRDKVGKADFDKEYCDYMVKDHKDDIDSFQKEAEKGNDADLKAWASAKLPTLEHHLSMAENVHKIVKNEKNR